MPTLHIISENQAEILAQKVINGLVTSRLVKPDSASQQQDMWENIRDSLEGEFI